MSTKLWSCNMSDCSLTPSQQCFSYMYIMAWTFWWEDDDDDVFVINQHVELDFL
jgi:hypothetical protein